MLVCTKKEVYKYLKKDRVSKIFKTKEFLDEDIDELIAKINEKENEIEINIVEKEKLDEMMDEKNNEDIVAEVPEDGIIVWLFLIIATMLLFFIVLGVSFSMFDTTLKGSTDTPGSIIVNYSDVNGTGNGISITNATPMTDTAGKIMVGSGNYFDFTVSGTTSNIPINYYVVLEKEAVSTLEENSLKVYLTSIVNMDEVNIINPVIFSNIDGKDIDGTNYKLLYTKYLDNTNSEFSNSYRLRIWIDNNATDYYEKTFSLKVNVLAEGTGE